MTEGLAELRDLVEELVGLHNEGEYEDVLTTCVNGLLLIREELDNAVQEAKQQNRMPANSLAVYYVSEVLVLLASDMQYAELLSPSDAEEIMEAIEPLIEIGATGLL